ncbi:MAG: Gfo/Idh/MocA family oxidoreductase, partial [Planctomycetota bacterium]
MREARIDRRAFLRRAAAAAAAPAVIGSRAFGANDRITMAGIGMGGRGSGVLRGFLGFKELQVLAVCDVVDSHAAKAKKSVDGRYGNDACDAVTDFRKVTDRDDIDTVLIGTPDHWHAIISCEAMKSGKDVYC